jgi:hypothetical protein
MHHLPPPPKDNDEPRQQLSLPNSVINQLFEPIQCFRASSNQLLSLLQTQHIAVQSTIAALELKVTSLEALVRSSQAQGQVQSLSPVVTQSQLPWTQICPHLHHLPLPLPTPQLTHADAN